MRAPVAQISCCKSHCEAGRRRSVRKRPGITTEAVSVVKGLTARRPVHLLYHGIRDRDASCVDAETFERQVLFLKKYFEVGRLTPDAGAAEGERPRVTISFDDGYRNNAEIAAPILKRHEVPATFFVCGRHSRGRGLLWFSYLEALETCFGGGGFDYHGEFIDMSAEARRDNMERLRRHLLSLRPHPEAMYQEIEANLPSIGDFLDEHDLRMRYAGLTEEQIGQLSACDLFSVQAHTEDHPFLPSCTAAEAHRQLDENKRWIERITGTPCTEVAYPGGDYDEGTISLCRRTGFTRGFAVMSKNLTSPEYEIPRIGIYARSLSVLAVKLVFGHQIRAWGIPVG